MIVVKAPMDTTMSRGPFRKICPKTVASMIAPAAARVFRIESAYLSVAAYTHIHNTQCYIIIYYSILQYYTVRCIEYLLTTSKPPIAPNPATVKVKTDH